MKGLLKTVKRLEPDKKHHFWHTVYDGFFTFLFTPNTVTKPGGVHIKDRIDLKRTMTVVVLALMASFIFGTYNVGHQHFLALGQYPELFAGWYLKFAHGIIKVLPIYVVAMAVGLGIEFYYAAKKGHGIEEGFLVTGALIPLIMPPDIPLWIVALAVIFAVLIGKEAFGGTGMNVVNIALLARLFVFFAYPTTIAGDTIWVSGIVYEGGKPIGDMYGWGHHFFDWIFNLFDADLFGAGGAAVADGFTGATPLDLAKKGWEHVTSVYAPMDMIWGTIPGSIGETSKPLIILGGLMLIGTGIASWRIMLSGILGASIMGLLFNAWGFDSIMNIPWYNHFIVGSFWFAIVFMATDPVTASNTQTGKWIYGFSIGALGIIIRVMNPAYPEGWMLAIIFMNIFVPVIDYYVVQTNIKRRLKRVHV